MPWWSWILIWGGLVLALLAMLVLLSWWLFRKAVGLLDELGRLTEKTEMLSRMSDELEDAEAPRFVPAVLLEHAEVAASHRTRVLAREDRRRARREKRITRARMLTRADHRDAAMRIKGV